MEIERFQPALEGDIWYEHWHRYQFATPLAAGRRVLDIACGEGYGSALLASVAASVVGVDVDKEIVAQARRRYGSAPRLEFREGRCEAIPLADSSVDLVVSFETLEHVAEPARLVEEVARVLDGAGTFVVSTPNKEVYTDRTGYRNPFHLRELYRDEFVAMLRARFPHAAFFGQRVDTYSALWPLEVDAGRAELFEGRQGDTGAPVAGVPADPVYFVAVCGRDAGAVAAASTRFSLLADRAHLVADGRERLRKQYLELANHAQRIDAAYVASQDQLAAVTQERDRLAARLRQLESQPPATGWRGK